MMVLQAQMMARQWRATVRWVLCQRHLQCQGFTVVMLVVCCCVMTCVAVFQNCCKCRSFSVDCVFLETAPGELLLPPLSASASASASGLLLLLLLLLPPPQQLQPHPFFDLNRHPTPA